MACLLCSKFALESTAADTAPVKASTQKTQQLRPNKAIESSTVPRPGQEQEQHGAGRSRQSQQEASRGAAAVVNAALAAAARSSAASDTKVGNQTGSTADARARNRRREPTPPVEAVDALNKVRAEQAVGQARERWDSRAAERSRESKASTAGSKRGLPDVAGARGLASRALQQIGAVTAGVSTGGRAVRRQQQVQQQQQQQAEQPAKQQPVEPAGPRVSVLDRLGSRESQESEQKSGSKQSVFERLSGISPGTLIAQAPLQQQSQAAEAVAAAQQALSRSKLDSTVGKLQQQQGSTQVAAEPRRSLASRLQGAGSAVADQQQEQQSNQQIQPGSSTAAPAAEGQPEAVSAATAGSKRKAPTAPGTNGNAAGSGAAVKKPATAASAGTSGKQQSSGELAALRAMLAAKEAEVRRLQQLKAHQQQQQEADERSVVVFNLAPHIPEAVVRAHFGGCGAIKRCSILVGRMPGPTVPGAYIEFETTMGALAAMGLAGSSLLNLQIQVGPGCMQLHMFQGRLQVCQK